MQVISYIRRAGIAVLCVILILCSQTTAFAAESTTEDRDFSKEDFVLAAQNEALSLYYSEKKARIIVQNNHTGYVWDSALPDESVSKGVTDIQKQEVKSLLSLCYTSINSFSSKTSSSYLESVEYEIETDAIKDGFAYIIFIPDYDVSIRIEFLLDEYGMKVQIPENGIKETINAGNKVSDFCKVLTGKIADQNKVFKEIEEDTDIPEKLKKNLSQAIVKLDDMEEMLKELREPYGIGKTCEELSEKIDEINKLMLGASGEKGFYSKLLISDEVSDEVKNKYRSHTKELKNTEMQLKIQIAQMQEISAVALVSVDLLPYFGACDDKKEGYMLYPDGCGALTYFKEKHGDFKSCYQADTYSSLNPDLDWEQEKDSLGLVNQAIPYFGIKVGADACIAYVSSGQAMSEIIFCPSGYVIPVNRIGAGFTYRQTLATSSINGQWQSGDDTMVFEEKIENYTACVEYQFLDGEDANYSKMAEKLRNYMEDEGILVKSELVKNKQMPLALDLFGGYNENILIFDKYVSGTTFSQASEIVNTLEGVPVLCNYRGVFSEGYGSYPTEYKLASELGEKGEIKNLSEKLKDGGGQLFLESNQLLADYYQSGYNDGELAIGNRFQVLKNIKDNTQFLFSPDAVTDRQKSKMFSELKEYGEAGLNETLMGSFVYADFGNSHKSTRLETVLSWKKILHQAKKELGAVSVDGGSDYTFSSADWLRNIPDDVSGYNYTDEAIPFYSMLVHGYMACTSIPDNKFYDETAQTLHAIEYGFLPYFSLTAGNIDISSTGIYASEFSSIYTKLAKTYNMYLEALGDLTDISIVSHERDGDTAKVVYENGTEILVNYSESSVKIDGVNVGAKSFAKIKSGEVTSGEKEFTKLKEETVEIETQGEQSGISVYSSLVVGIFVLLFISIVLFGSISFFNRHRS